MAAPILAIQNLSLSIDNTAILKNVSLDIQPGKILGLVGESGSGKSMTALSLMGLLPNASQTTGSIIFDENDILSKSENEMCKLRGDDLAMIFQEPMTALNPVKTIGDQISEGIRLHRSVTKSEANEQTEAMLEKVGLPVSQISLSRYPFELSGGQRQRVMIAIACAMRPKLLIADEPTTALDVSVQARILELLEQLVDDLDMAMMLITHDLGVVANVADTICVLRNGEVMEQGDTLPILKNQKHAYTRQLAKASAHQPARTLKPVLSKSSEKTKETALLSAVDLTCTYQLPKRHIFAPREHFVAVNNLSLNIYPRQIMGLVGESGCGKSTFARTLLGLNKQASGKIVFNGSELDHENQQSIATARSNLGIVFQDPYGSFNPRHKVERIISEPLHMFEQFSNTQKKDRVAASLVSVGLSEDDASKFPHEFSGGQRQRIAIARALITEPKLIIADEPVSALDVSIRAQILDLMVELNERLDVAYLFISHDLSVVKAFCDEVSVMKSGSILEHGPAKQVFENPKNDYTKLLVEAAPDLQAILAAA